MRTSTAYFAGVGTVAFAIAAGLGGGYLAANIVSPHEPKYGTETSRIERRMASQPLPVTTAPSEPVPYIHAMAVTALAQPQRAEAAVQPAAAPAEEKTASPAPTVQPAVASTSSSRLASSNAMPSEQAGEKSAAPQDAFARARDADVKRAAIEKRRAERRQRWAEKRRVQQPRERELDAVEEKVREVTEPRQAFAAEPARIVSPRIGLFDLD
jgi:hypothetical protein